MSQITHREFALLDPVTGAVLATINLPHGHLPDHTPYVRLDGRKVRCGHLYDHELNKFSRFKFTQWLKRLRKKK